MAAADGDDHDGYICPACRSPLDAHATGRPLWWACSACDRTWFGPGQGPDASTEQAQEHAQEQGETI